MAKQTPNQNPAVTNFLDELSHPLRNEIELLRNCILSAHLDLTENIKWNGPNYCFDNEDRITMRIQPPTTKQIQIILHCGAKVQEQPKARILKENFDLLTWKTNDRAVITFKNIQDIEKGKAELTEIVSQWIGAAK